MFFFNLIFFYPFQNLKKRFGEILNFSQFLTFIKYLIKYISWELAPAQAGAVYWLISNSPILQHLLILLAAPKLAHFTHLIKPLSGFNRDIYFFTKIHQFHMHPQLFCSIIYISTFIAFKTSSHPACCTNTGTLHLIILLSERF